MGRAPDGFGTMRGWRHRNPRTARPGKAAQPRNPTQSSATPQPTEQPAQEEEPKPVKMMAEPKKVLSAPDLDVLATSVRVPVVTGHAVSILATFARPIDVAEARSLLDAAPGVTLMDDPEHGVFPTPLDAAGRDDAYVGRIRQVPGRDDALALFSCADNLRIGAALDAVMIAERLFPA